MHDRPLWKPACSSCSRSSVDLHNRFSNMAHQTFPWTDRSVMPRQLLQSERLTFFGRRMIVPLLQSSGTVALDQHSVTRLISMSVKSWPPFLSISSGISSFLSALPFLSPRTATTTSAMPIRPSATGRSSTGLNSSSTVVAAGSASLWNVHFTFTLALLCRGLPFYRIWLPHFYRMFWTTHGQRGSVFVSFQTTACCTSSPPQSMRTCSFWLCDLGCDIGHCYAPGIWGWRLLMALHCTSAFVNQFQDFSLIHLSLYQPCCLPTVSVLSTTISWNSVQRRLRVPETSSEVLDVGVDAIISVVLAGGGDGGGIQLLGAGDRISRRPLVVLWHRAVSIAISSTCRYSRSHYAFVRLVTARSFCECLCVDRMCCRWRCCWLYKRRPCFRRCHSLLMNQDFAWVLDVIRVFCGFVHLHHCDLAMTACGDNLIRHQIPLD